MRLYTTLLAFFSCPCQLFLCSPYQFPLRHGQCVIISNWTWYIAIYVTSKGRQLKTWCSSSMEEVNIGSSSMLRTTKLEFDQQSRHCTFIWFPVHTCFRRDLNLLLFIYLFVEIVRTGWEHKKCTRHKEICRNLVNVLLLFFFRRQKVAAMVQQCHSIMSAVRWKSTRKPRNLYFTMSGKLIILNTSNLKSRHYFEPPWIKIWWFYDKIIYIFIFINLFCKVWHQGRYQKFIQCEFRNQCLRIGAFSKFTNYVSITQNVNA